VTALAPVVDVDDVRARVDALLAEHVARLRAELVALSPDTAPLADAVEAMLGGGKRLRAAFAYWSWRAHGGEPGSSDERAALRLGAALELFQAAALFHDDVMDDSDTRRGRPTAHRVFADAHQSLGLRGDARRFGDSAAILLGDLALVGSDDELAAGLEPVPPTAARRVRVVFDQMRSEVTAGQFLDLLAQSQPWPDDPDRMERTARLVIRAKSARYSVEQPLVLGAALAGADEDALAACREVGLPLGEAFQLRDDLLGVFGDPAVTGKPAGDDLREGKRTVLVARALAAADPTQAALLNRWLGDPALDAAGAGMLAEVIAATGAREQVDALIRDLADGALTRIAAVGWSEPARSQLVRLARRAVDRTS